MACEALGRPHEADSAFDLALARADTLDESTRLRLLWTYGFAVSGRLPERARRVFDAILRVNPRHPQRFYGRAMLAVGQGRPAEAIEHFDSAIREAPDFVEARRYPR